MDSGLPAVVTFDGPTGEQRPTSEILAELQRFLPGDVGYGHLHAEPETVRALCRDGVAPYFIVRDPRDIVVSHVHYVTEMEPDHVHHDYYRNSLSTFDDRLRASILGRPELDAPFPDIGSRFAPYEGWLNQAEVAVIRFEDLITNRDATLERILDHAQDRGFPLQIPYPLAIQHLSASIAPARSPTFRSGKIGKWREAFKEEHVRLFNQVAGDLLEKLGYNSE